ncbi:MAG: D-3-phosphoglycerate dehydrogenase [Planctomycetota bacterium]|nr:MAG: D-3-phosphoglycerate dehydrogenase [Planctomycetota bacterium]
MSDIRILVADKIAEPGLELLKKARPGVSFDVREGLSPPDLARIVGEYDGMLVRSAVEVTADVLKRPGRLSAIARAGVGVDNIDVESATRAGIVVLNTPDANTVSTAEHTLAMLLALFRRIPDAHAHVRGGLWKRSQFTGDQVAGKTLGVVGFGRIGRAVAKRALGLDMRVVAFDPFVAGDTALEGAVRLVRSLDELLPQCDCVTLHASLSDDNRALLGAEAFRRMKRGSRLVNCARGALIDETALAEALKSGQLAGAAIDVYENEPPVGSPLLAAPNVVLTPHLAASTVEAQTAVSVEAVEVLLAYLLRGEIRSAVNVRSLPAHLSSRERAVVDLMDRMGRVLSAWCEQGLRAVRVDVFGEGFAKLGETLARQAVVGLLNPHLDVRVNVVNAAEQARQRGIRLEHGVHEPRDGRGESVTLTIETPAQPHTIEGTVYAEIGARILAIDGYRMEIVPDRHLVLIFNDDRPGVIGLVGQLLGEAGVNIADMALSRRGKTALMLLKLDAGLPDALRRDLESRRPPILSVTTVSLPPLSE